MDIVFYTAHPDDEAFGPAATIYKLSHQHTVHVITLCNGARPGADSSVAQARSSALGASCRTLGACSRQYDAPDCELDFNYALGVVESTLAEIKPSIVFTHSPTDIHRDHRTLAEAVIVGTRPKPESPVDALLFWEQPASTEWSWGTFGDFKPTVYVDVTDEMYVKYLAIEQYATEIYDWPDARSSRALKFMARNRGKTIGVHSAEAFQLAFSRSLLCL